MKKIISFICACLMLGSLAACGKPNTPAVEDPNTPYLKYTTPVTYTTVRQGQTDPGFPSGMDLTNNPYCDYIKQELNVTYTFNWVDANYDTHLLQDLVANTLPDVFFVNSYATYQQLYQANALADLQPGFDKYATQQMKDQYASYGDGIWSPFKVDGKMYALPMTNNGYQQELLWVRQDWLDTLNLPVPKTIDDIQTTALAFMWKDPGGNGFDNGVPNTIGLMIDREHSFDQYRGCFGLEVLASAMGAFPRQYMKDANGQVYYGSVQPEFKQVLAKVKSWVDMNIIPASNFDVNDQKQNWLACDNGTCGMWFFPWSWPYENQAFKTLSPNGTLTMVPAPLDTNGDGKVTYYTGAPYEGMVCVNKNFKNPEVIYKVFQVYYDMTNDIAPLQDGYAALQPVRDANTLWYYIAPLGNYDCRYNDTLLQTAQQVKDYVDSNGVTVPPIFTDPMKVYFDAANRYKNGGSTSSADWMEYMRWYEAAGVGGDPLYNAVNPAFYETTPAMLQYGDALTNSELGMIHDILTNAQPLDYFDSWVADWHAGGGDQILQEVQAAVDARG